MSRKPNGYVLHETQRVVVIATGFARRSTNAKTAAMAQVWILPRAVNPVEASHTGADSAVCGNCPARHFLGGDCYVRLEFAPLSIWQAWRRGVYPQLPSVDVFKGRVTRFGAYGDPTHIPLPLLRDIANASAGWTGYTHQWRNPLFAGYREFLMASADGVSEQIDASRAGWRTFRVAPVGNGVPWRMVDEISCPASAEMGHASNCERCRLCAGTAKRARNIVIRDHSGLAKIMWRAAQARERKALVGARGASFHSVSVNN